MKKALGMLVIPVLVIAFFVWMAGSAFDSASAKLEARKATINRALK